MTSRIRISNPKGLARPAGTYSHVARVKASELLFIACQVPVDAGGKLVSEEMLLEISVIAALD